MEYPRHQSPHAGQLLQRQMLDGQTVEIRQHNGCRWMHFDGEAIQSMMIVDTITTPIIPYNIAMLTGLLFGQQPKQLLNLGAGGNTFERLFTAKMPELNLTSVESSPLVIELAQRFLPPPEGQPIVCQSAEQTLIQKSCRHDIIFCDIFNARHHPDCLFQPTFYGHARDCLTAEGVMVINLLPESEQTMLQILLALRQYFPWVLLLDLADYTNILLYCLPHEPVDLVTLETRSRRLSQQLDVDLTAFPGQLIRLPRAPIAD